MKDATRDEGITGSTADYRIREVEARLDRRIAALESQRERMKWTVRFVGVGFAGALVALVGVLWGLRDDGALTTGSLFAEEVVLRDGEGTTRGHMGTDAEGRVEFALSDRDGRERMRLTVLADGAPGLTISDSDARPRAVLAHLPDGTTNLVFADARGASRTVLGLEPDGSTHALFADRAGTMRTLVGVGADGAGTVSIFEDEGEGFTP